MPAFFTQIKDNWVVLAFIGALIVSWSNINSRLALAEKERANLFEIAGQIQEIQISIAVIREKITSIEKKI